MQDVYQHPTIRSLAAALAPHRSPAACSQAALAPGGSGAVTSRRGAPACGEYVLCGAVQLLFLLGCPALTAVVAMQGYEWISAGPDLVDVYLRAVAFGGAIFLGLCTFRSCSSGC